ncbi:MAG: ABC transporter permease [Hyphomicrobiaceae bacterium]|nr:ABC transporter permease [Hyphomicrobiaceae bacterium]
MSFVVSSWLAATLSLAAPYLLASLGLILTERAGVLALTAEGLMLVGALAGIGSALALGGHPMVALGVAMLAAAALSLVFSGLVILLRVNQVIAGLAFVFFCQGLTNVVGTMTGWENRPIAGLAPLPVWPLSDAPFLGPALFRQDVVVYLLVPLVAFTTWALMRTRIGLELRAVGEDPQAADAMGISVWGYRLAAVTVGAMLIGLAGAYLSVVSTKLWIQGMTGGRGWIAIALVIFARWTPWRALGGALLFSGIEAMVPRVAAAGVQVPKYFMFMTPYLATLAVMIWSLRAERARAFGPAALGQPYVREERR